MEAGSIATVRSTGAPTRRFGVALTAAGLAVIAALTPFLPGLIAGLILYVLARPLDERLARHLPRRLAAVTTTMLVFVCLLVPGVWLLSIVGSQAGDALRAWRAGGALERISGLSVWGFSLASPLARLGAATLAALSDNAVAIAGGVTTGVLNTAIALLGLYYLLVGGSGLWARASALLPTAPSLRDALARRFVDVTYALLLGTGLAALAQGFTVGASFAIVGLNPPELWGFITACVSVLPVLGSALVWLPGSIVLLADGRFGAAAFVAAVGLVIASNIDNVVRMLVYRRVSGIHPLITLLGAFAGIRVFGIIGVFLGPLLLSYFVELLAMYEDEVARARMTPAA